MNKKSSGFIPIVALIIIGAAVIIGVGMSIYLVVQPLTQSQTIDASEWQTYRNEKYGFELRLPAYYTNQLVEQYGGGVISFYDTDKNNFDKLRFQISVVSEPPREDPREGLKNHPEQVISGPQHILVAGIAAEFYKIDWQYEGTHYPYDFVIFDYDGKLYTLSDTGLHPNNTNFSQILSTFKFD